MSSGYDRPLTTFPSSEISDELLLHIAAHLGCAKSLRACTLVSRQWRYPMQEELFRKFSKRLASNQLFQFVQEHPWLTRLMTRLKLDFPLTSLPTTPDFPSLKRLQLVQTSQYRQSFLCPSPYVAPCSHCLVKIELKKMTTSTLFLKELFTNLGANISNTALQCLKLVECKVVDDHRAGGRLDIHFKRLTIVLYRTCGVERFSRQFFVHGLDSLIISMKRNRMVDHLFFLNQQGPRLRHLVLCDKGESAKTRVPSHRVSLLLPRKRSSGDVDSLRTNDTVGTHLLWCGLSLQVGRKGGSFILGRI